MRRAIPVLLGLVFAYAAALWWLVADTPARADAPNPFPSGSSYSRSEEGAALAATYLRGRGHMVQPLLTSSLEGVPRGSVILVINPPHFSKGALDARPLLTVEEERFILAGGRVILALDGSAPSIEVQELTPPAPWARVHRDWPAVGQPQPAGPAKFLSGPWLKDAYAVFTSSNQPVVARRPMGEGDVVAIASASIFQNAYLKDGANLAFLDSLVQGRPAVYFDEGAHGLGAREGTTDLLRRWKLLPFLASLLVLTVAILVRKHRALGRPDRDDPPPPVDAVDLVEALGRLYATALSDEEALGLHRDHLRRVIAEKTGLRGVALRKRVDLLLAGEVKRAGSAPPAKAFEDELSLINRALRRAHEHPR